MAEVGGIIDKIIPAGKSTLYVLVWVVIIVLAITIVAALIWFLRWRKRKYNLKVEIKLTRNDARITNAEWGKGNYDAKRGVVMIKRPWKGSKPVAMKIFDIRKYMQGTDLLTVIQVGPEDFRPVLNDSWTKHNVTYNDETKPKTDEKGNPMVDEEGKPMYETVEIKESILNIKTETEENKAWKAAWEEAAKNAYTITSFIKQFQTPIAIGMVIICCFIGFAILWTKIPGA